MLTPPPCYDYIFGAFKVTCVVTDARWQQNTYVVTHAASGKTLLIDPGGGADFIIQYLENSGARLVHILLTHPHHDHIGAVAQLSEHFGVSCNFHKDDARLIRQAPMYALTLAKRSIAAVTRYETFEELVLEDEEFPLRALHTPGHTKGSVCYHLDGFVFSGDTLLYQSIGRTDLPGSSLPSLKSSVTALLVKLSDNTVIFPGHGKPWVVKDALRWWSGLFNASPPQYDQFVGR